MKSIAIFLFSFLLAFAYCDDKYTTKYDNINLDDIISNKRLLKNYVYCLLDKGNCSPDGQELKKVLPDALKTDCVKCSPRQKDGAKRILRHMINKEPEWYEELEKKYDPTGIYKGKYEEELKEKKEAEPKTKKN